MHFLSQKREGSVQKCYLSYHYERNFARRLSYYSNANLSHTSIPSSGKVKNLHLAFFDHYALFFVLSLYLYHLTLYNLQNEQKSLLKGL